MIELSSPIRPTTGSPTANPIIVVARVNAAAIVILMMFSISAFLCVVV